MASSVLSAGCARTCLRVRCSWRDGWQALAGEPSAVARRRFWRDLSCSRASAFGPQNRLSVVPAVITTLLVMFCTAYIAGSLHSPQSCSKQCCNHDGEVLMVASSAGKPYARACDTDEINIGSAAGFSLRARCLMKMLALELSLHSGLGNRRSANAPDHQGKPIQV